MTARQGEGAVLISRGSGRRENCKTSISGSNPGRRLQDLLSNFIDSLDLITLWAASARLSIRLQKHQLDSIPPARIIGPFPSEPAGTAQVRKISTEVRAWTGRTLTRT